MRNATALTLDPRVAGEGELTFERAIEVRDHLDRDLRRRPRAPDSNLGRDPHFEPRHYVECVADLAALPGRVR